MIEATVIFKDGIQLHLSIAVSFEDINDEIETNSKIGFIQFNEMSERIPSYMYILGRILKRSAEKFWSADEDTEKEITDLKQRIPEEEGNIYREKEDEDNK